MPRGYIRAPEALEDISEIRAYYQEKAGARVARYVPAEMTRSFRLLAATPASRRAQPSGSYQ